jgi:RNA polymerase sigma factor (sigma-70 family)
MDRIEKDHGVLMSNIIEETETYDKDFSFRKPFQRKIFKEIDEKIVKKAEKSKAHLKDEELFIEYAKTKNSIIRNRLVQNNQALVTYIVNKYYSNKKDHVKFREDLLQEGTIGLMSAIDGYKVELGFKFSTYATWWVRQAVNNYLINIEPMIHVPSHVRTQHNKIIKQLKEENKSFQSLIEQNAKKSILIDGENVSEKMMNSVQSAIRSRYISSIEQPLSMNKFDTDSSTLRDILPDHKESLDKSFDQSLLVNILEQGLSTLSAREKYILLLRFDVIKEDEITNHKTEK